MKQPMTSTCSSLYSLVGAPLMAATFHLCTMLDTHTLMLVLFFTSLMAARFSHYPPPSAMICTNSSIVKGLAGAYTRIISFLFVCTMG